MPKVTLELKDSFLLKRTHTDGNLHLERSNATFLSRVGTGLTYHFLHRNSSAAFEKRRMRPQFLASIMAA